MQVASSAAKPFPYWCGLIVVCRWMVGVCRICASPLVFRQSLVPRYEPFVAFADDELCQLQVLHTKAANAKINSVQTHFPDSIHG